MKRKNSYSKGNCATMVVCSVLFITFTFLYVLLYQSALLAILQDNLSNGQTSYNPLVISILFTVLLFGLQRVVNYFARLHDYWEAWSYLPSCLLLAMLTDVNMNTMSLQFGSEWLWSSIIIFGLFALLLILSRLFTTHKKARILSILGCNMLFLSALFVSTVSLSNNNQVDHMEATAWQAIHKEDYGKVLDVGVRSTQTSRQLTALRNIALAKLNRTGEELFVYPQPYHSEGLMMNKFVRQSSLYGPTHFYSIIGEQPYGNEKATDFYARLFAKNNSIFYKNLYESSLLLDKNLNEFTALTINSIDSILPIHYKEAFLLSSYLHQKNNNQFEDSTLTTNFNDFVTLLEDKSNTLQVKKNLLYKKYRNTYWYYYYFSK